MTVVASNYARKENDLYQTEPWATEALLRHFPVADLSVWEPSHGNGKITNVLMDAGAASVTPSDICVYDDPNIGITDFLQPSPNGEAWHHDWIITNPPYGKGNRVAVRYAELALERAPNVALLLTAKFDFGKTRHHLFRDNPRFTAKINLVDRIQWFPGETTGTEDHCWLVWTAQRPWPYPALLYEGKRA